MSSRANATSAPNRGRTPMIIQSTRRKLSTHHLALQGNVTITLPADNSATSAKPRSVARFIPEVEDSAFFQTFRRGKPKEVGVTLIVAALLQVAFGVGLAILLPSITLLSGVTFWAPILYISAGSLAIDSQKKPSVCRVKASLGLSIVSAMFSVTGFILACIDFAILCEQYNHPYNPPYFYNYTDAPPWGLDDWQKKQYDNCLRSLSALKGLLSLVLILDLLVLSLSFVIMVYGCQALNFEQSTYPQVFVIEDNVIGSASTTSTSSMVPISPAGASQPKPSKGPKSNTRKLSTGDIPCNPSGVHLATENRK